MTTFRSYASQLQQQHQEPGPPAQGSPPTDATLDADIAAFLSEGHQPDETPAETAPNPDADPADASDGDEPAPDAEVEPEGDPAPEPEAPPAPSGKLDAAATAALTKAIEDGDPVAFVKALGTHAEKLLTSKAHVALRLQVKEAEKAQAAATADKAQVKDLSVKLGEKYGDPIAARKAAEEGDVDTFIDMVEKWGGHSWNDIMKWAAAGIAGRKERLEKRQRAEASEAVSASARQEQKQAEVRAWVDAGVKKLDPELHMPEVVELVMAEIRAGFRNGITTPAKALPLAKKKLEAQYQRLHKVFGKKGAPAPRGRSPSAAADHTTRAGGSRPSTLEEDIAWAKQQAGVR